MNRDHQSQPNKTAHYDAIIVGSGAGGGAVAWHLCQSGWRVLVIERGPDHSRSAYTADELQATRAGFFQPKLKEEPHYVHTRKTRTPIETDIGWTALCTGGGTVHMGGYLYRFHPSDFELKTRFPDVDGLADWPISYDELEPYYTLAEYEIGVCGDGSETFVPRSAPHPMPPVRKNDYIEQRLKTACEKYGLKTFATPLAVNSVPYQDRPACQNCDACGGFGCPIGAKGSAQESFIRRALQTGRLTLLSNTIAAEVRTDAKGKATGVVYIDRDSGTRHQAQADLVCVSCSSVESARLLMLSESPQHPNGIGNHSGLLGQHLQFHGATLGSGRIPRLDESKGEWNPFINLSTADFYNADLKQGPVTKGAMLRFDMVPRLPMLRAQRWFDSKEKPIWGKELLAGLKQELGESDRISFEAFHDFLPDADTYMELDSDRKDAFGLPSAKIHLGYCPSRRRVGQVMANVAFKLIGEIGGTDFRTPMLGGTVPFLVQGTCRFGEDPNKSVLDKYCRVHGVDNLYVVDGSFMPTSGGSPPTLTIVANALRVAEHMTGKKIPRYYQVKPVSVTQTAA